jgi:hypothetical protein
MTMAALLTPRTLTLFTPLAAVPAGIGRLDAVIRSAALDEVAA